MDAGIYIHFPFCLSKCKYCGFYSVTDINKKSFIKALSIEIDNQAKRTEGLDIKSIYFGGGTPSLLDTSEIKDILDQINRKYPISDNLEITIEANPATITEKKALDILECGINRISLGLQSFDSKILDFLGRIHTVENIFETYNILKKTGFKNISTDLIFAIPQQTDKQWLSSLNKVLNLNPQHISLYCLSYDQNTELTKLRDRKKIIPADENRQVRMYESAIEKLNDAGYIHYEISNFSRPNYQSRHNSLYWKNLPYIGLGPSAHSYLSNRRFACVSDLSKYVDAMNNNTSPYTLAPSLTDVESLKETAALNIRLLQEGICIEELKHQYPKLDPHKILDNSIYRLIENNLMIEYAKDKYRLTKKGILFADEVASELI